MPRSRHQGDGRPKLVERVEARYPGTEKWLFSPLWRLADQAPMAMSELRDIYESLPIRLRNLIVLPSALASDVFWRREFEIQTPVTELFRFQTVDDLLAGLALLREAEVCQGHLFYRYLIEVVKILLRSIDWEGLETTSIPSELTNYLHSRWVIAKPILSKDAQEALRIWLKELEVNSTTSIYGELAL